MLKKPTDSGGSAATPGSEAPFWQAADRFRNHMDPAEYRRAVLGLVFLKYVSDASPEPPSFPGEGTENPGSAPECRKEGHGTSAFRVPEVSRWPVLQAQARRPTIGKLVDDAIAAIERENPPLRGTLPGDYARSALDPRHLGQLIDLIGALGPGPLEDAPEGVLRLACDTFSPARASAVPGVRSTITIILSAGRLDHQILPSGAAQSNAMISINGKPVIGWILDNLREKGAENVRIAVRADDLTVQSFLEHAYKRRMNLEVRPMQDSRSILESLQCGLDPVPAGTAVHVVLGDTLITDPFASDGDYLYVGSVTGSRRWCLAVCDEHDRIVDYLDKRDITPGDHTALAGFYCFLDGECLARCLQDCLSANERELSDLLRRYGRHHPLTARPVTEWYDFGHIDNLVRARQNLLQARSFNTLKVDSVLNTITKRSANTEKLRDELLWYQSLPAELQVLAPRIVRCSNADGHVEIVQEYYGYPALSELFVWGDLPEEIWLSTLRRLFAVLERFRQYPGKLDSSDIASVYVDKTFERLQLLQDQDAHWRDLLSRPELTLNGQVLRNLPLLRNALHERLASLVEHPNVCITHGDFCFSNILFDVNNHILRLVDPRGRFGKQGLYGDSRYDVAKLRHSICGLYDFIVADLFALHGAQGNYATEIFYRDAGRSPAGAFDRMVHEAGYDLDDIRLIEALLFLSMPPLHRGRPARQHMMYLTGLRSLNELL
jgi:dTDP-glucose pyrophosphorylase